MLLASRNDLDKIHAPGELIDEFEIKFVRDPPKPTHLTWGVRSVHDFELQAIIVFGPSHSVTETAEHITKGAKIRFENLRISDKNTSPLTFYTCASTTLMIITDDEDKFMFVSSAPKLAANKSSSNVYPLLLKCQRVIGGNYALWSDGSTVPRCEVPNILEPKAFSVSTLDPTYLPLTIYEGPSQFYVGSIIKAEVHFKMPVLGAYPGVLEGKVDVSPVLASEKEERLYYQRLGELEKIAPRVRNSVSEPQELAKRSLDSARALPPKRLAFSQLPATFETQSDFGDSLSTSFPSQTPRMLNIYNTTLSDDEDEDEERLVNETLFSQSAIVENSQPQEAADAKLCDFYEQLVKSLVIEIQGMNLSAAQRLTEERLKEARTKLALPLQSEPERLQEYKNRAIEDMQRATKAALDELHHKFMSHIDSLR
ncbi:hypothetical protein B9G98_00964 [Wickerhamiella sorbophila]|uniref:Uncharacterized protein n=1 Tax=Wickerhamiella sorbophila TaxID=45607 RepID=A0A2T0FED6_9ASCO|nr:hypothetical protein B9G98_00964 [Wickerhamiella sorbophila]PRT53344.1 hypothetical protein B9G98_00964 [Wickerhamiella sorbophila]